MHGPFGQSASLAHSPMEGPPLEPPLAAVLALAEVLPLEAVPLALLPGLEPPAPPDPSAGSTVLPQPLQTTAVPRTANQD